MNPFVARNVLKIALAVAAVVLALIIGFEANWGSGYVPPAPSKGNRPTLAEAKLLPPLPNLPAEQAYPETGARPLFTPVRRPAPAGQVAGSMVKGQFALNGVIVVDGLAIAMLKEKSSGKTVRVEKGKEVNGLTVATIERDRVTLTQGEDSEVVALLVQRSTGTPAAGFAPAGPFSTPASATTPPSGTSAPFPGQPAQPGTSAPVASGGPMPTPTPAARAAAPAAPSSSAASTGSPAAGSSMEDVLARSRARRAQRIQEQEAAKASPNVQK